jgi:hypothetical protein
VLDPVDLAGAGDTWRYSGTISGHGIRD